MAEEMDVDLGRMELGQERRRIIPERPVVPPPGGLPPQSAFKRMRPDWSGVLFQGPNPGLAVSLTTFSTRQSREEDRAPEDLRYAEPPSSPDQQILTFEHAFPPKKIAPPPGGIVDIVRAHQTIEARLNIAAHVAYALSTLPTNLCIADLKDLVVEDVTDLGRGAFGAVERGRLKRVPYPLEIAIKTIRYTPENYRTNLHRVWSTYYEVFAMSTLNALAHFRISPHSPLFYEAYLCHTRSAPHTVRQTVIAEELANGSFKSYMRMKGFGKMSNLEFVGAYFQLFYALIAVHIASGMSHNDVKADNVLFFILGDPCAYLYNVMGSRFILKTSMLWLVSDWGQATGSRIGREHSHTLAYEYPHPLVEEDSWNSPRFYQVHYGKKHYTSFRVRGEEPDIPLRDLLGLTWMFLNQSRSDTEPYRFLQASLARINASSIRSSRDLQTLMDDVFSQERLGPLNVGSILTRPQPDDRPIVTDSFVLDEFRKISTRDAVTNRAKELAPHLVHQPLCRVPWSPKTYPPKVV